MGFLDALKVRSRKDADVPGDKSEHNTEQNNVTPNDDSHSESVGQTSKPSSEKESTLVDEHLTRNATPNNDTDKELASRDTPTPVHNDSNRELVTQDPLDKQPTPEEKKEDDGAETPKDEEEYPNAWRLTLISIALCLCVFCVALVCTTSWLYLDAHIQLTPNPLGQHYHCNSNS
jgi:hypothetical protein